MARTLSDTLIIAMIEAATRLTAGRGPIGPASGSAGGAAAGAMGGAVAAPATGETGATASTTPEVGASGGTSGSSGASSGSASGGAPGGEQDPRTAEQIASDFRTIYAQIEDVVRVSAEQETKSVGFAPR